MACVLTNLGFSSRTILATFSLLICLHHQRCVVYCFQHSTGIQSFLHTEVSSHTISFPYQTIYCTAHSLVPVIMLFAFHVLSYQHYHHFHIAWYNVGVWIAECHRGLHRFAFFLDILLMNTALTAFCRSVCCQSLRLDDD